MLTLAIPYYRRLDYLRLAIDSVRRQTSSHWQLIVSDDGCVEPGAEQLVASYNDPRLQYAVSATPLGMVGNWNRCLDLARNDLVTILHADDELSPHYVETMQKAAEQHPDAAAFFCRAEVVNAQGKPVFSLPDSIKGLLRPSFKPNATLHGEQAVRRLARGNFIFCPALCYRKSLLDGTRFDDTWQMVQDLEFTTRLLFQGKTLIGLPETAYRYRRHGENASETYTRSLLRFEEEIALLKQISQQAESLGWRSAARAARQANIVKLHLLYRILLDTTSLRFQPARTKLDLLQRLFMKS
jgi:glycosyltransferase involved in cell wall biosynthesis